MVTYVLSAIPLQLFSILFRISFVKLHKQKPILLHSGFNHILLRAWLPCSHSFFCFSGDFSWDLIPLDKCQSHAWTGWHVAAGSLLTSRRMTDWTHTANAATVTSCRAAKWLVGSAHCVIRWAMRGQAGKEVVRYSGKFSRICSPWILCRLGTAVTIPNLISHIFTCYRLV